jgi:hypothetical protein
MDRIIDITSQAQLLELLCAYDVPTDRWGQAGAKSVFQLFEEIQAGESELHVTADGRLQRVVNVVNVVVEHAGLRLVEEEMQIKGGPVRRRQFPWVAEKMLSGERPADTARRALREELGIDDDRIEFQSVLLRRTPASSGAYPGLSCLFVIRQMRCELPAEHFRREGYVERDAEKEVLFGWRPRERASLQVRTRGQHPRGSAPARRAARPAA